MSDTMIAKAARAMYGKRNIPSFDDAPAYAKARYRYLARAAISAIRTPDEAMREAARDWGYAKYGKPVGHDGTDGCWQSQIDAILAEEPKP